MKLTSHPFGTYFLIPFFLCFQIGCATTVEEGLDESVRSALGTIGIVSGRFLPNTVLDLPPAGALEGAGRGIRVGAGKGLELGSLGSGGDPYGGTIIIAAGLATVGAIIGPFYGVFSAEPEEKVKDAEISLHQALMNLQTQENIREHVLNRAQTKTQYTILELPEYGPTSIDSEVRYSELKQKGITTVLEVQVLDLGIKETEYAFTPPLAMFMQTKARLIRVAENEVLHEHIFKYETEPRSYTEWAEDDAKLFREAIHSAYGHMADDIISEVFISHGLKK